MITILDIFLNIFLFNVIGLEIMSLKILFSETTRFLRFLKEFLYQILSKKLVSDRTT